MSMASCTSPRVSDSGLPISRVMSRDKSSLRFTRVSAARYRISARRGAGTRRQCLNAALAASTASFTSSCVEEGKIPTSSPVLAGLRFSNVLPRRAPTHSPLIKFLWLLVTALVVMLPPADDWGLAKVGRSHKPRRGGKISAWQFNLTEGPEPVKQVESIVNCLCVPMIMALFSDSWFVTSNRPTCCLPRHRCPRWRYSPRRKLCILEAPKSRVLPPTALGHQAG